MAMEAQLQIRQNAMEVQDYFTDLFDWEKSMKKKDASLHGAAQPFQPSSTAGATAAPPQMPAPRGRAAGKSITSAPTELQAPGLAPGTAPSTTGAVGDSGASQAKAKSAASHTYSSYSKWDKMDVDKLLESDDEDSSKPSTAQHAKRPQPMRQSNGDLALPQQQPGASAAARVTPAPRQPSNNDIALPVREEASMPASGMQARQTTYTRPATQTQSQPQQANQPQQSLPPVRNQEPQTADAWRARGNDLFKAGQYQYAKECYTRSILLESTCVGYANRAMAELKLQEWAAAEDDCGEALELDRTFVKAYHRRGTARRQLGRLYEAAEDFEEGLRYDPTNKALAADRAAALAQYLQGCQLQPLSKRTRISVSVAPPPAPQQQQQQQSAAAAATPAPAAQPVAAAPAAAPAAPQPAAQKAAPPSAPAAAAASASSNSQAPAPVVIPQQPARGAPSVSPASAASAPPASSPKSPAAAPVAAVAAAAQVAAPAAPSPTSPTVAAPPAAAGPGSAAAARAAAAAQVAAARGLPAAASKPPKTSTEFENAWRSFSGSPSLQAQYLQLLQPAALPSIFKSSLTPQVLTSLLRVLLKGMAAAQQQQQQAVEGDAAAAAAAAAADTVVPVGHGVELLKSLAGVPRFDMTAMCIPAKDRAELSQAWAAALPASATAAAGLDAAAAETLRKKYKL